MSNRFQRNISYTLEVRYKGRFTTTDGNATRMLWVSPDKRTFVTSLKDGKWEIDHLRQSYVGFETDTESNAFLEQLNLLENPWATDSHYYITKLT